MLRIKYIVIAFILISQTSCVQETKKIEEYSIYEHNKEDKKYQGIVHNDSITFFDGSNDRIFFIERLDALIVQDGKIEVKVNGELLRFTRIRGLEIEKIERIYRELRKNNTQYEELKGEWNVQVNKLDKLPFKKGSAIIYFGDSLKIDSSKAYEYSILKMGKFSVSIRDYVIDFQYSMYERSLNSLSQEFLLLKNKTGEKELFIYPIKGKNRRLDPTSAHL